MTLNLVWGSEIDADQNPKAAAASAQTMLITSALFIANCQFRARRLAAIPTIAKT